jgi:N-methylhydantoinase A
VDAQVFDADALSPGDEIHGPAIIDRRDTTIFIPPDYSAWIDALHNTRMSLPD